MKRAYLERLDNAPVLESPSAPPPEGAHIILQGEYLAEHTLFLDNRTVGGQLGVAALTPLQDDNGRLWLIQRGFLPTGATRDTPTVETPSGQVNLEGRWQNDGDRPPIFGAVREGQRLQRIDTEAWPELGGFAYQGWVHLEQGEGALQPWWEPNVMPPQRHVGYAFQWWGLAAAAFAMMVVGHRHLGRELKTQPGQVPAGRSIDGQD